MRRHFKKFTKSLHVNFVPLDIALQRVEDWDDSSVASTIGVPHTHEAEDCEWLYYSRLASSKLVPKWPQYELTQTPPATLTGYLRGPPSASSTRVISNSSWPYRRTLAQVLTLGNRLKMLLVKHKRCRPPPFGNRGYVNHKAYRAYK
eukprot:2081029-Amphidinium_carterae.1